MKHGGRKALLLLAALSSISESAAEEPGWERLTGADLHAAFADMELGDDVHFAYRFHADGRAEGTEMGKPVAGTWHTTAKQFCWRWARSTEEECHIIKRNGNSIRAFRNGTEAWSGDLSPLHK